MPGIYGLVSTKKDIKTNLSNMSDSMHLYDHFIQDSTYIDETLAASRVHLGKIGLKDTPASSGNLYIWIEGEAYNIDEVNSQLNYNATSLESLLLQAEQNNELEYCLSLIDGYFCAVLYDSKIKKVKLISDRYGMRLLHWYHKDGVFSWSSEVKGILSVDGTDKTLDHDSYNCFMELGYLLGEQTWFKNIKLIKPASIVEYDFNQDRVSHSYYWSWANIKKSDLSFKQAVDKIGELFIEAVNRRFDPNDKVGIALSGGLDSRALFAAVDFLYPEFSGTSYTFGIPGCDDITIAEKVISRSHDWKHDVFYFSSNNWYEPRIQKVWDTDGMQDMMHMHGSEFFPQISKDMNIMLNGYAGDAILGGSFLPKLKYNERITATNAKPFYGRFAHLTDLNDNFYDIDHIEPHLYMNRVRRFTLYGSISALSWIEQRKPFFDNKLVELIFSLPDEYRAENKLYSAMLQKFFPKYFKDIPWQRTMKPAGKIGKASIPGRALRKGVSMIKPLLRMQSHRSYTNYPAWIKDEEIADKLSKLFDTNTALYPMLTKDNFMELWLEPHLNGKLINNSNQILRAATIEIYLQHVFNNSYKP